MTLVLLLSCATLSTACAGAEPRVLAAPPVELLTCADAPDVADADSQRVVAKYMIELWDAGDDCHQRLDAVRQIQD